MEKMPLIHSVMPALVLPLWFIGCACLASGGQLQFSGSVITAACWNETDEYKQLTLLRVVYD